MPKILLAYDGGDHGPRLLATAAGLARAMQALVGVISVVPLYPDRLGSSPAPWDHKGIHRSRLEEARRYLEASSLEPEIIEVTGDPAERILATAEQGGYDMVVLGGGRRGIFERLFGADVRAHVLERANTVVVIVN